MSATTNLNRLNAKTLGTVKDFEKRAMHQINMVSAMRPGLVKIIQKVCISRYFESPQTDLHVAENTCGIDYANSWSSQHVNWLPKSQSPRYSITQYEFENTLELNNGDAWASLPNMRTYSWVAPKSKLQWLPATLHNREWIDHCQVHYGTFQAIPILDRVDIEEAYGPIASQHHSLQWHVR